MENMKDMKKYQNQGKLRLTLSSCSVESIQNGKLNCYFKDI